MVGRVRHLVGQVEDLALRPVTARLAHFLLEQVDDPTLTHPAVTRALIANHLATTPESISRSLRVLEKAGTIRFDRHRIIIVNPDILRQQALL
jgi:CRP-like cAMP-binding protein